MRRNKYLRSALWIAIYLLTVIAFAISSNQGLKQTAKLFDQRFLGGRLLELVGSEHVPANVQPPEPGAYDWVGSDPFIAIGHGLGPQLWAGINTRATLEEGLRRGFRIFEVDVSLTIDGHLVCFHGDNEDQLNAMSMQQYTTLVRASGVEPFEFSELVKFAREHPHVRFVLDVKNRFDDVYRILRASIGSPQLGHSFIPQIYHFSQLPQFRASRFFAGEIFTSYHSRLRTANIIRDAERLHVHAIALTRDRIDGVDDLPASLVVLTYPVDNVFDAARLRCHGVRGIYTSYITPAAVPEVFEFWPAGCTPGRDWRGCHFTDLSSIR